MRLLLVRCSPAESELVADRCFGGGAAGVWEQTGSDGAVELRVGVEEADAAGLLAAIADLEPADVSDQVLDPPGRTVAVADPRDDEPVELTVPGTVFGDGAHPTTAACLAALSPLVQSGTRLLDVGCGSGVLGILAARWGAAVVAVDIDAEAVAATAANAATAEVSLDASTTPVEEVAGTFDVVAANVSAGTLSALAPALLARTAPGGVLVVSGILTDQWPGVRAVLGGSVVQIADVDGWVTAVVRPGA